MDFYEGVVLDYLRADPALFINPQCLIQINPGENPDTSGPHWYCDAVTLDLRHSTVFLCEMSYSKGLYDLRKRLGHWNDQWAEVRTALVRDCYVNATWEVRPWLFVPADHVPLLVDYLDKIAGGSGLRFAPRIRTLEMVQPWRYRSWKREGDAAKDRPQSIPEAMWL